MRARRGRAQQLGLQLHALSIYGALGSGAPLDFAAEFASPIGSGRECKPSRDKGGKLAGRARLESMEWEPEGFPRFGFGFGPEHRFCQITLLSG
jgi:hypothetical protein